MENETARAAPKRSGEPLGIKIFFALVILGFLAIAYGAGKTYLDNRAEASRLVEEGVATEAKVTFATEHSGRRIDTYHELLVTFPVQGQIGPAMTEVLDCPAQRYGGAPSVDIVYDPGDPDTARLAACVGDSNTNVFPGFVALIFFAFAMFMLWRLRGFWTS